MKKLLLILFLACLLTNIAYASENIEINKVNFEIPDRYCDGELNGNSYRLNNTFSIKCIDENISKAIGLWACESEKTEDLNIAKHPVRHFCQYNKYVQGNHSHAYFVSGKSIYEISWVGLEINEDVKKLIKNTPPSEIDDDAFYTTLDKSIDIYKQQRKAKLNQESQHNYPEAKYNTPQDTPDDTRFREILFTYYLNK